MSDLELLRLERVGASFAFQNYGKTVRTRYNKPIEKNHFLLYLRDDGGNTVTRRMWDYGITDIVASETNLFHLAKGPNPTPHYQGSGFKKMMWNFPSYVTIVFDNPGFEFNFSGNDDQDPFGQPILFWERDASRQYHPNYSFYNAEKVDITVLDSQGNPTTDRRKAIRLENHIRGENDDKLKKNDWREYKFDLLILKPVDGSPTLHRIDPDGQNQGPPDPP